MPSKKKCVHGKAQNGYYCKACPGKGICVHNRNRKRCKDCGGSQICEHGRQRSKCKDCGGSQICEHGRIRSRCKDCPSARRAHSKPRAAVCSSRKRKRTGPDDKEGAKAPAASAPRSDSGEQDKEQDDDHHENDNGEDKCSICLDALDDTAQALHDDHRFCAACLDKWISECANRSMSNRKGYLVTCPLCKKKVRCKRIRS